MGKSLETLIRLAKYHVDEKRRVLGELYGQLADIEQKLADLEHQVLEEQKIAKSSPDAQFFSYGLFHKRAMSIRADLQAQIAAKEEEVEAAREDVNEAYREQKVYEEAEKKRVEAEKLELNRKENNEMDEIGQNLYRRKQD